MIYKERNPAEHPENDKLSKAGAEAEEQMAFYLRRAFVDSDTIHVFNDLRLVDSSGDVAQIDHLIHHRYGFIVIESKSVSSAVRVNEHGEFTRLWNGRHQGMPSPVQQARRQIEFLRRLFRDHTEQLLAKLMGVLQAQFGSCPYKVIVAVSDKGVIERQCQIPELVKADQVVDRIRADYERHRSGAALFSIKGLNPLNKDGVYSFNDEEMSRIRHFLIARHQPLQNSRPSYPDQEPDAQVLHEPAAHPVEIAPPETELAPSPGLGQCTRCGMQSLIKWGRYGYYWKCIHCDNNMPIKEICPSCGKKMKLRKDGLQFFKRCEFCNTEERYCVFEEAPE